MKPPLLRLLFLFVLLVPQLANACITCNKKLQEAIFDSQFYPNLLALLSPFIVLGIIVFILAKLTSRPPLPKHSGEKASKAWVPLTAAATVLGIGLGGFVDGIVLHQILQWHQMLSNKIPPVTVEAKSVNMFWDGVFHLFTLIVTITGTILLWRLLYKKNINRSGYLLTGGLVFGWALFNIVEGIADHHLLKLHNVKEIAAQPALWNIGFLIFSIVLVLIAFYCLQRGKKKGTAENV